MTLQRLAQIKQDTGRLLIAGVEAPQVPISKLKITTVNRGIVPVSLTPPKMLKNQTYILSHNSTFLFFFFWSCRASCRILVPRPGIEPVPPTVEARSLNHWAAREFLILLSLIHYIFVYL